MNNNFRTKDLYLSAFLCARGLILEQVEREDKICWFVFDNDKTVTALADDFWSGKAECNARAFSDALRTLKDRIFNE